MSNRRIFCFVLFFCAMYVSGMGDACAVETDWHGQFRINSYYQNASKDDVFTRGDDIQASRLRFRPTLDFKWDNGVKAHIQLNIGHINSNVDNARYTLNGSSGGDPVVSLRHGYISAPIPQYGNWTASAGLIPLSDNFGDTLFSGDWDWNPLTYMLMGTIGDMTLRVAHANLNEGTENNSSPVDDVDQWIVDLDTNMGLGASFYALNDNTKGAVNTATQSATSANEYYVGLRYAGKFEPVDFNAFVIYNWGKRKFAATAERENSGVAAKVEAKVNAGSAKVGVMALYASGDADYQDTAKGSSDAFITPMSIVGTTGYWGYTGKLNVQGTTDTGIDTSFVNIDGGGYATSNKNIGQGLTTVQVNVAFQIIPKLDGYAAASWYTHNEAQAGFKRYIGTDLYAQVKYAMWENLNIEAGVDYALLAKGHGDSVTLGAASQASRTETLVFSRLQLEF